MQRTHHDVRVTLVVATLLTAPACTDYEDSMDTLAPDSTVSPVGGEREERDPTNGSNARRTPPTVDVGGGVMEGQPDLPLGGGGAAANVASNGAEGGMAGAATEPETSGPALISAPDVCETALVCEAFDALPVDTLPSGVWTANQNLGSVRVDATRAYSGTQSVKATTAATQTAYKAALLGYGDPSVLPTVDNAHFGRLMFFLESAPEDVVHWTFLAGAGRSAPQEGYPTGYDVLYRYGGQKPIAAGSQLMASYETPGFYTNPPSGPHTDCQQDSAAVPMPVGRWACAEWRFDGGTSEMQLWVDGTEVEGLHVIGNGTLCRTLAADSPWVPPVFSRIDVGWESYQPDVERSIWVDDFVLSADRIGCPATP